MWLGQAQSTWTKSEKNKHICMYVCTLTVMFTCLDPLNILNNWVEPGSCPQQVSSQIQRKTYTWSSATEDRTEQLCYRNTNDYFWVLEEKVSIPEGQRRMCRESWIWAIQIIDRIWIEGVKQMTLQLEERNGKNKGMEKQKNKLIWWAVMILLCLDLFPVIMKGES